MGERFSPNKRRWYTQFCEHDWEFSSQRSQSAVVLPESDKLCARCQAIELQEILQRKVKGDLGSFVMNLASSVEELKASDCVLCQLFGSMSPSDFDKGGSKRSEHCNLQVFSANRVFAGLDAHKMLDTYDITLLGVVHVSISEANTGREDVYLRLKGCLKETGYLCSVQANKLQSIPSVRPLCPESFNINFVADCIAYFLANHCKVYSEAVASPPEWLRVIDCQTRTIVKAPSKCQYVALSYVWGHSTSSISTTTLQNVPKLIDDSIHVTLKFNLRYLWVDRYCMD